MFCKNFTWIKKILGCLFQAEKLYSLHIYIVIHIPFSQKFINSRV